MSDIQELSGFATATVSDALDKLGLDGSALGVAPLFDGARLCGRAYTVRYVAAGSPPGTVGDYLDDVEPGQVVVLDNGGRQDCTVWGDILTAMADNRGVAGTVIDGVCRDVQRAIDTRYPIFSRGRFMRTGKDRVEVSDVGRPVTVGGVNIAPGDALLGDSDGIVRVPWGRLAEVVEVCRTVAGNEAKIVEAVLSGSSLTDARAQFGYHKLQRGPDV